MREKILLVDDETVNLKLLGELLRGQYDLAFAKSGQAALELAEQGPDLILLDIMMPDLDGLDVCRRLKSDMRTQWIPVVFVTARTDPEDIEEGLSAGAYYYLTKPIVPKTLLAVVMSALDRVAAHKGLRQEISQTMRALTTMHDARYFFRTIPDARNLGQLLANACPDPEKVVVGFTEMLVNAVEHGNLGITYDEKGELNERGVWDAEVERRLRMPEYASRRVEVIFERRQDAIRVLIRDQGQGFDWQSYLDFNPARAFDNHGRGIAMATGLCFDDVEYRGKGNEVLVTVNLV
ncbi:MAG: response regulator [Magnetococcales bacterium]|nr:response regulator [Magnetococcales bacterium]